VKFDHRIVTAHCAVNGINVFSRKFQARYAQVATKFASGNLFANFLLELNLNIELNDRAKFHSLHVPIVL